MKDAKEFRIQITKRCEFPRLYALNLAEDNNVDLAIDEIVAAAKAAAALGFTEIRLTGGEPLQRDDICDIVKAVKAVDGISKVNMTTNAILLVDKMPGLKEAGIDGIEVYLDTFFQEKYIFMTGGGSIDKAMDGLESAVTSEIDSVGIAATVIKGLTDDEILNFGQFALNEPIDVVFYERPGQLGMKLPTDNESGQELIYMDIEEIRGKFKGAVKLPQTNPLIDYIKWFEANGKIGFASAEKGKEYGAELMADGMLKKFMYDSEPVDIAEAVKSCDADKIKAAIEAVLK